MSPRTILHRLPQSYIRQKADRVHGSSSITQRKQKRKKTNPHHPAIDAIFYLPSLVLAIAHLLAALSPPKADYKERGLTGRGSPGYKYDKWSLIIVINLPLPRLFAELHRLSPSRVTSMLQELGGFDDPSNDSRWVWDTAKPPETRWQRFGHRQLKADMGSPSNSPRDGNFFWIKRYLLESGKPYVFLF